MPADDTASLALPRPAPAGRQRVVRESIRTLHRWIGLSLGLLFAIVGLSGSWLAFYPELDLLLDPVRRVEAAPARIPLDAIVAALHATEPQRDGAWRIELPRQPDAPIQARYSQPVETRGQGFKPLMLTLDPNTLRVTSRHFWGDEPSTWLYNLHYTLLMGDTGKTLLASSAILILLLLLSGLALWWPHPGRWRGAFAIKRKAVWKRRIYDWHVKPGVYTLLISLTLCVTGLMLLKPAWFSPALASVSPITPFFTPPPAIGRGQTISAERAVAIARARFPETELRWIETPTSAKAIWRIQLYQPGEPSRRFPRTHVWIDANTGAVIGLRDPRRATGSDTVLAWLHPLHNGEALGLPGRIAACLGGFLPLLALMTGFVRWRHKAVNRQRT